ncbi:MAG TPA: hypothetical protein IGS17_19615 [Oscillatoriales cyanobacterium M59_W2019_021]|nr:MAG: hypothetical protein D6728_00310 [Cyanobacteria bacterium J055]HIK33765.1 hypothetical protein [Oscillatoriales cyanobacterium M4454_W2019_049]HIK53104.1 hypothetical protein [Oscillatoriales cyanobacterium M59_W2019_021]
MGDRPIGCRPFRLQEFIPYKIIRLAAFDRYGKGQPRLDRIDIHIVPDVNRPIEMVKTREVISAILPYAEVTNYLERHPEWNLHASPDSVEPLLLHVQADRVDERFPNPFDLNLNVHLWYVRSPLSLKLPGVFFWRRSMRQF